MGEVELKPCPFCGGGTKHFPIKDGYIVQCIGERCRANPQMWGRNRANAFANWNTRQALKDTDS
jgi:hypothetical protein